MGRSKLPIRKRVNAVSRQVTFSKRKLGLLKKAYELSTLCDIELALLMFSPSGRLTCFSGKSRIEDVFAYYLSLPNEEREEIKNPQILYEMLCRVRRGTDLSTTSNPDETKQIERLHHEISRTQKEIKAKANLLRLLENRLQKPPSSEDKETYEKFLVNLIARYDARLEQLERPTRTTASLKKQPASSPNATPLRKDLLTPQGDRAINMYQSWLQPGSNILPMTSPAMQERSICGSQPLQEQYTIGKPAGAEVLNKDRQAFGELHQHPKRMHVHEASLSSQHIFLPPTTMNGASLSLWTPISTQQSSIDPETQGPPKPIAEKPTETAASVDHLAKEASLQPEHAAPLSFPEPFSNLPDDWENYEDSNELGSLLASWDHDPEQNLLNPSPDGNEQQDRMDQEIRQMGLGDYLYSNEELIPIPPNNYKAPCMEDSANATPALEPDLEFSDWNFIVDP